MRVFMKFVYIFPIFLELNLWFENILTILFRPWTTNIFVPIEQNRTGSDGAMFRQVETL